MRRNASNRDRGRGETVGDIVRVVGDELTAFVAMPGTITYKAVTKFFEFIGSAWVLFSITLRYIIRGEVSIRDTIYQMAAIGFNSLPIVLVTVTFSGMVLALYMADFLVNFGVGSYVGAAVSLSVAREIGPVLAAVVVAARSGSAMAAEIGSMKVTEQIDALRALATSPIQYLVVPRLLACVLMLPILTVMAVVVGIAGGYLVAVVNGVAGGGYISSMQQWLEVRDVLMGMLKTVFFGATIAIVGCQQGLSTTGGATGVGKATTNAVVFSIIMIYIINFFLAYIMFGGRTAL